MPRKPRNPGDVESLLQGDAQRLLMTLAGARTFQAAASTLGVSQASISQQVQRLERLAGRSLFRRSNRGLQVTREGEAVIVYARAVSELADDLRRQLGSCSSVTSVRIGMSEDVCRTALSSVLQLFMRQHLQIDVRVISGTYKTISDAIENRSVDLAVMRRYGSFAHTTLLWKERLVWNGQSGFSLPIPDPVPLVVPVAPSPARDVLIDTLRSAGRTWRIHFESVGLAGVEAALRAGMGVCGDPHRMKLLGTEALPAGHGLPDLPEAEFVMVGPDPDRAGPVIKAFAQALKRATANSGLR